jgi:hypothetical protein
MPTIIHQEADGLYVMNLSGILRRAEFGTGQETLARGIDAGVKPRVLAILRDFQGWEKGADWNDLDFQISHGSEIAKIAIVGDPRWEDEALAFAGAGFRQAPVKFFPEGREPEARAWLAE